MTRHLHLSPDLALPLDIVTMRVAEYGDSGSGKTAFARLLAEKVHDAHHRFCAIDLKNDWWGLKSSADGSAAGIPVVIFGGPRGDVKLYDDAGSAIADAVASIDQSVVIDLDSLSRMKQERFLTHFLDRLYEANRRPLLLFCDEADRYAPQKPMTQDAILSLSSSEDIARRGRKRGIGSVWLTQRTAVLNKNVSEFANLTVVFRTPGERDLKELEERVGRLANKETVKEVMRLAPGLNDGEAFFLSSHPKLRKFMPDPVRPIQLPLPWTFDSSATPGVGQRRKEPKVLAETDLAAIESRIAQQVERAKAEDPKELRKEIARLKAENAKKDATLAEVDKRTTHIGEKITRVQPKLEHLAEQHLKTRQQIKDLRKGLADAMKIIAEINAKGFEGAGIDPKLVQQAVQGAADQIVKAAEKSIAARNAAIDKLRTQATALLDRLKALLEAEDLSVKVNVQHNEPYTVTPAAAKPKRAAKNADADPSLSTGERAILIACAQHASVSREQLSVLTGYKRSSRDTYLQRLTSKGLAVVRGDGEIEATQDGVNALGSDYEPLPTGADLQRYWLDRLSGGEQAILKVAIDAYPEAVERDAISEATEYKRSSRDTYIQRLTARKLVTTERGTIRASEVLFG